MSSSGPAVPRLACLLAAAWVIALVCSYVRWYGAASLAGLCDVALILGVIGLWRGHALLVSVAACVLLVPSLLWVIDVVARVVGLPHSGLTAHLFDPAYPWGLRLLSAFHLWAPPLLLMGLRRTGYHAAAGAGATALIVALLLVSWLWLPPPSADPGLAARNLNYVWGLSRQSAQPGMPPWLWLALDVLAMSLLFAWPMHRLLRGAFRPVALVGGRDARNTA